MRPYCCQVAQKQGHYQRLQGPGTLRMDFRCQMAFHSGGDSHPLAELRSSGNWGRLPNRLAQGRAPYHLSQQARDKPKPDLTKLYWMKRLRQGGAAGFLAAQ